MTQTKAEAAPVTLIVVVENDARGLERLLTQMKPWVAEIIVSVQPSTDDTLDVANALADKVIEREHDVSLSPQFEAMIEAASNDVFLNLDADETLAHPERLADVVKQDYDVWWLPRIDYLSDRRVQFYGADPHERLFRRGALKWQAKMHTFAEIQVPDNRVAHASEIWVEHRRTIEGIRWRQAQYMREAEERGQPEVIPGQKSFLERAEQVAAKMSWEGYPRRILCAYNGVVGIGDTLMTTPVLRQLRKDYPGAHITYLTQQGAVLHNNPNVDLIDPTPPERWNPEWERDFDLVFHWETSLTGDAGRRINGYEQEAYWAQVDVDDYKPEWFVTEQEAESAAGWVQRTRKCPRLVGMSLSSSALHRTWQHSEAFVRALMTEYEDIQLIFFGDQRCRMLEMEFDTRQYRKVVSDWGQLQVANPPYDGPGADRIIRSSGQTNIREVAALMPHLDLLVSPDSGLMHISGCFGTPCVAYFNLVPPELRVKHMPNVIPVMAEYPCSPCFIHGRIDCDKTTQTGAPCLHTVTVDRLMGAVESVLG